jgi:hypothetical protein
MLNDSSKILSFVIAITLFMNMNERG